MFCLWLTLYFWGHRLLDCCTLAISDAGISSTAQTAFILFCKCSTSQVKHSENLTENLNVDFQADFLKTDSKPEANVYMEWQRITADGLDPLFSRIRH